MKFVSKAAVLSAAAGIAVVGGAGVASAYSGAGAAGVAQNSPGVVSGNLIQVPIDLPLNICGNTVDAGALLNPAFGNTCVNL
ncbi:chaplin [Streptomyces sp. TM32]|uniref:chaplin n=1 Tax=Streptomyces sp. TM32 TaxID=1652669 RepID=UPI0010128FF2|nr:chaplin [Streptomyces sp. TM32]RXS69588.1 chaplin [Streptomyces sp. TM32]